jgi:hypothetical protein
MQRLFRIPFVLGYLAWAMLAGPIESQQPQRPAPYPLTAISLPAPSATAPGWTPEHTLGDALRHLASHAGVAFVGTVQKIDPPAPGRPGVVTVTFGVDQPVLGAPGTVFTLREWSGLWTLGRQRYAPGQRALFFFHPPNAAGLSSPVDGQEGIVPLVPTTADAAPLLDVRRLNTRLLRRVGDPLPGTEASAITLTDATSLLTHPGTGFEPTPRALAGTAAPNPEHTPATAVSR